jgi:hypothetical protein
VAGPSADAENSRGRRSDDGDVSLDGAEQLQVQ